jgi:hypothetical protein
MDKQNNQQLVASFMEVTGCAAAADAAYHLSCCGWNLHEALTLFFSIGAGPSGTSHLHGDAPRRSSSSSGSQSRWESETRVGSGGRRHRQRFREDDGNDNSSRRQRHRVDREDHTHVEVMDVDDGDLSSRRLDPPPQ